MNIQASLKVLPNNYEKREDNYKLVDEALKIIIASNLKFVIGCSETTIQGDRDQVIDLIKDIQDYYYQKNIEFIFFVTFEYNIDNFYIEDKKMNIKRIEG